MKQKWVEVNAGDSEQKIQTLLNIVSSQTRYYFDIKSYVFELYISWNN